MKKIVLTIKPKTNQDSERPMILAKNPHIVWKNRKKYDRTAYKKAEREF